MHILPACYCPNSTDLNALRQLLFLVTLIIFPSAGFINSTSSHTACERRPPYCMVLLLGWCCLCVPMVSQRPRSRGWLCAGGDGPCC